MTQHIQFLMHDNHAGILRFPCIMEFYFLSLKYDASGILGINTGQNLHQRGFSCSVLADQYVDLAG